MVNARQFGRDLEREYRAIVDAATTMAVRGIARRAIRVFTAATPRRTGRLLSGWRVYDTPNAEAIPKVLSFRQIPIRSASQVISDADAVINGYDFASGNLLFVVNQCHYVYPYNSKRPNLSIAVGQVVEEADQLIAAIESRLRSLY